MNKEPKITLVKKKQLVGHPVEMSLVNNKNQELFSGFMPLRKQINNAIDSNIYEVLVYKENHFKNFSPTNTFTKWAAQEVDAFENLPESMDTFILEEGLYAVFHYKGLAKDFGMLMQYIFTNWLPQSKYILDTRPHFNLLGEKTKKNAPDSEEDVYIPIKEKA